MCPSNRFPPARIRLEHSHPVLWQRCLLPLLLILLAIVRPVAASVPGACSSGARPGATLLFPYFEADLSDADGRKTLISIQNTSGEAVLTNVVLWTNCGLAVLSFNLLLGADEVRPIDLRDLIVNGRIPVSGDPEAPPDGCGVPVSDPVLDEARIASLQATLTGQPNPADGLCYSEAVEAASLAVGYVTVDVVERCSDLVRTPHDEGYFGDGGVAGSANVLWGDFFLIDGQGNLAQGFEAVSLVADPSIVKRELSGFYERGDDRRPLGSRYRARFLRGGSFDGGTELLTWVAPKTRLGFDCRISNCTLGGFSTYSAEMISRRESGDPVASGSLDFGTATTRLRVGGERLPTVTLFGTVDFQLYFYACKSGKCTPPSREASQAWLLPIYTAEGRFSVGLNAVALDGPCSK